MTAVHDPVDELTALERRVAELRAAREPAAPPPGFADETGEKTVDELRDEAERAEVEDFDRFWSVQNTTGIVISNVCGMDLHLPRSVPLLFEVQARRLKDSKREEDVKLLFDLLFGRGTYDALVERGLDAEQFGVLLMWGSANASGRRMSLPQARAEYQRLQLAAAQGKAPTPAASGATSSGSGRSSKPTSPANTRHKQGRKKRSRR